VRRPDRHTIGYPMGSLTPPAVAAYLTGLTRVPHPVLDRIRAEGGAAGVPIVDPLTGALLHALTRASGATRALEIGTAIGYSTVWMATALPPSGLLVTLERDHARATTARAYVREAGVDDRVNVMIGDADRYLHKLAGPFDLIFQDGDKSQYTPMLDRLVALLRPGGLLITDNVLWSGAVVPGFVAVPRERAADTAAIAEYNERLAADPRLRTTWLPVGDGVAMAIKTSG
jgi:predicted O-methyltransferase YrrM